MDKRPLSSENQQLLRNQGIISKEEIAYTQGDLFIAESAISGQKRIINPPNFLTESPKKLLLG